MELNENVILDLIHKKTNRPLKFSELMRVLDIPETQRREFRHLVRDMAREGSLVRLRGGRYGLPDEMNLVSGVLHGHPDGYGFVVYDEKEPDIYIGRQKMNGAMHLDHVVARIESKHRGYARPEGRIIRILERKTKTLVGSFEPLGRDGWVVPSDPKYFQDVFVPGKEKAGAEPGHLVTVEIIEYPTRHNPPVGRVIKILGHADDPQAELQLVFHKHGVRLEFPPKVLKELHKIPGSIPIEEWGRRRDLTQDLIFTIDGPRAKDFDDAVSLEKRENGYRLGVHIADVSHYVKEDGAIDQEAFARGTSIYYADGVIPMLPFELTNEICSLKPRVERLTLSVDIDYDLKGNVTGYEIYPAIIRSQIRFTYRQVADLLQNGDVTGEFKKALPTLKLMEKLSQTLRKRRFQEGSVDFNIPEPEIILNAEGKVERIVRAEHNIAHELIEEFMLAANRVVARHLHDKKIPSIHRIHEPPDEDRLAQFNAFIMEFGYRLPSIHHVKSTYLHNLLQRVRNRPEERVINTLLLRSLKKAVYSEKDPGHFCLGFDHYTHFTSPIRRYPDLVTHRLVKKFLTKRKCSQREREHLLPRIAEYARQSTEGEIRAMQVEREVADLRRAQYMEDKVGHIYIGVISGVGQFGIFVELEEVFVEGLVHISNLRDDYYVFNELEHCLKGRHRHKTYKIGDRLKVRVARVDIAKKQIDFSLAETK